MNYVDLPVILLFYVTVDLNVITWEFRPSCCRRAHFLRHQPKQYPVPKHKQCINPSTDFKFVALHKMHTTTAIKKLHICPIIHRRAIDFYLNWLQCFESKLLIQQKINWSSNKMILFIMEIRSFFSRWIFSCWMDFPLQFFLEFVFNFFELKKKMRKLRINENWRFFSHFEHLCWSF